MRKRNGSLNAILSCLVTLIFALCGGVSAVWSADETIVIGTEDGWSTLATSDDILQLPGRGGYSDLTITPFHYQPTSDTELLLSFDSAPVADATGRYSVRSPTGSEAQELTHTAQRTGTGALLIDGPEDRLVVTPNARTSASEPASLFAPGTEWGSFSIEFWFYPVVLTDGDVIMRWRAHGSLDDPFRTQEVSIEVDRGAIAARFENFFVKPDGTGTKVALRGNGRLIPRTWSHHLIRFDGTTGLLEYVVDGSPVDLTYVSQSGRQDGSVFYPRIAPLSFEGIVIGDGPVCALDEVRIERRFVGDDPEPQYNPRGGSFVTDFLDLGSPGARVMGIDALYDTPGLADVFLYYRLVNLRDTSSVSSVNAVPQDDWIPVTDANANLDATGRFLQLRAELFPDTRAARAPTLSQIAVTYEEDTPPLPPTNVRATPGEGSVTISFAPSQEPDIQGYLVYYGDRSGRYFGTESDIGTSPIDVGRASSVTITGLQNGRLYFFAVQAYDGSRGSQPSPISSEVAARPARVYQ